jgi:hypothetical protein
MMSNSPSNPIIHQILKSCLTKYFTYHTLTPLRDITIRETAYDYDQSIYFVQKDEGDPVIKFGFTCNGNKQILNNGGDQMLNDLYKGKI